MFKPTVSQSNLTIYHSVIIRILVLSDYR